MKAPFMQIEMWLVRMESAIEQGKNTKGNRDIRDYGAQIGTTKGSRRVRAKKKYTVDRSKKQKNIFSYMSNLRT